MAALSIAYGLLVLALSVTAFVAVWRANRDKVRADLLRLARLLRLPGFRQ